MLKPLFTFLCIVSLSHTNLFTITDAKGNVFKSKEMKPTYNACLNQKSTEYSLQAVYDELHRAERMARMAEVFAEASPAEVRAFRSLEEAEAWLSTSPVA